MTASMYQGEGGITEVVGKKMGGNLPKPMTPAKSDLQFMLDNERKQHEQAYIYANGHNDHGMGQ